MSSSLGAGGAATPGLELVGDPCMPCPAARTLQDLSGHLAPEQSCVAVRVTLHQVSHSGTIAQASCHAQTSDVACAPLVAWPQVTLGQGRAQCTLLRYRGVHILLDCAAVPDSGLLLQQHLQGSERQQHRRLHDDNDHHKQQQSQMQQSEDEQNQDQQEQQQHQHQQGHHYSTAPEPLLLGPLLEVRVHTAVGCMTRCDEEGALRGEGRS